MDFANFISGEWVCSECELISGLISSWLPAAFAGSERHNQHLIGLTRSDDICLPLVSIIYADPDLAASSDMAASSRSRSTWLGVSVRKTTTPYDRYPGVRGVAFCALAA